MTIETKVESEGQLIYIGLGATTSVECADGLLKGYEVEDRRYEEGRKFIAEETYKIGIALNYLDSTDDHLRLVQTDSSEEEAFEQDQALERIIGAFELPRDSEQILDKLGLLIMWSHGRTEDLLNETVLTYSRYTAQNSKDKILAYYK